MGSCSLGKKVLKDSGQGLSSAQPLLDLDATSLGIKW